jgi:hypothetical protein
MGYYKIKCKMKNYKFGDVGKYLLDAGFNEEYLEMVLKI